MAKRTQYHILYDKSRWLKWRVDAAGETLGFYKTKAEAVKAARALAKVNQPSQVVVHGRDGRIQTEFTYQADPERYEG